MIWSVLYRLLLANMCRLPQAKASDGLSSDASCGPFCLAEWLDFASMSLWTRSAQEAMALLPASRPAEDILQQHQEDEDNNKE